ncbi:aldo/keto reductase [Uliginosibacterium gangwonense]|uniref:aldo/keto reductase n=1 Tax=Uliginosibacterium gangwonense TaxID=392736 RepID=UPI000399E499|nr:aldo/keto reductase [Uliginosibacterium gangwonense]
MAAARDHGVNFFDNAETYAAGNSETIMGQVLAEVADKLDAEFCQKIEEACARCAA